nr:telomere binding protein [Wadden Sea poxvirus]
MNHFVKHAASKLHKPNKNLVPNNDTISLQECIISFNFDNFYYCNDNIFIKNTNTLDDVFKSLSIIESFKYEKHIIIGLLKLIRKYGYINDLFFTPIGWLTGIDSNNETKHNVVIKLFLHISTSIKLKVKEYLSTYSITDMSIVITDFITIVNTFNTDGIPSAIISFFPFDTDYFLIVFFFGTYNESYCGLSYTFNKEKLYIIIETLKQYIMDLYILNDEISRLTITHIPENNIPKKKFPIKNIIQICEIVYQFDETKFDIPKYISNQLTISPFIPKKLVSLIDLPCNVEIKCNSKHGIDYVTHIDNKRIKVYLIILKDSFLKDYPLTGIFVKENLIWKGLYTYRIIKSNFPVPELKVSDKRKKNNYIKNCFHNYTYTTRIGSYII